MQLTFGEQMRIVMHRRGVTARELAKKLDISRQNLYQRLGTEGLTEKEMREYARALGCTLEIEIKEPKK